MTAIHTVHIHAPCLNEHVAKISTPAYEGWVGGGVSKPHAVVQAMRLVV